MDKQTKGVLGSLIAASSASAESHARTLTEGAQRDVLEEKLKDKRILLQNPQRSFDHDRAAERKKRQQEAGRRETVAAATRRREAKRRLNKERIQVTYAEMQPVHALWQQYIAGLIGKGAGGTDQYEAKMMRADFHGAKMAVVRATVPAMIGLAGICILETENTFRVVTPENKLATMGKAGTVFAVEAGGRVLELHGSHMQCRASERAVKKFKAKNSLGIRSLRRKKK